MTTTESFGVYVAGEQIDGTDIGVTYVYVTTPLGKVRMTEAEAEDLGRKLIHAGTLYGPTADAAPCHCGQPIPANRTAYCSDACLLADQDHGPDTDADGGEAS